MLPTPSRLLAALAVLTTLPAAAVISLPTAATASTSGLEAEAMALPSGSGLTFQDTGASGGAGLLIWSNASASGSVAPATPSSMVVLRARGDQCDGSPVARVSVDGVVVGSVTVGSSTWTEHVLAGSWASGTHQVQVAFTNDLMTSACDRNLRLDRIELRGDATAAPAPTVSPSPSPSTTTAVSNPFAGAKGYDDPNNAARAEADRRRSWDPAGAAALDKVASGPYANWFGDWVPTTSLASAVDKLVTTQTQAGALPVLVAYAIPHRDCGQYSAGGLASASAYKAWIQEMARGIGSRKAVVVLEPDALALMGCLSTTMQQERFAMLASAVEIMDALPATSVYLDAGGAKWHPADVMASRLSAAGVSRARGFTLNVSNFVDTATNLRYGNDLSARLQGKHFIIDTSRNGLGEGTTWCNPEGRALGQTWTSATGSTWADAYTWIKRPGESDGTCNGGPAAGTWWTEYAIGLGQRTPATSTAPASPLALTAASGAVATTGDQVVRLSGTHAGAQNVEVFAGTTMLARAVLSSSTWIADVPVAALPAGTSSVVVTAWNSPAGTSATQTLSVTTSVTISEAPAPDETTVAEPTTGGTTKVISGQVCVKNKGKPVCSPI